MQNASTVSKLFAVIALLSVIGLAAPSLALADDEDEASCWISATPDEVYESGSTTLYWGSDNAEDAWIDGIGDVSVAGSRIVYGIDEDTTFELIVENDEGTATCETEVTVRDHHSHPTHSGKAPGCTLYRENTWGNGVTLRWNTTNASSAYLSGVGAVSAYGMYTVYPTYDTTYTLTVYGNGTTGQCEIEIDRGYGHYPTHPQNYYGGYTGGYTYPYVSLTQIPYTGMDLGVVGTAVYFLALALFAISGGYLLAYYQGGVFRLSFAQEVKAAMRNQARSVARFFSK